MQLYACVSPFNTFKKEKDMELLDTVAAVSTPFGKGGIAVIRISGEDAIKIADKVFSPASGKSLFDVRSQSTVYGNIYVNEDNKRIMIDDGLATVFRAPKSFTGEDTVEISCHGGILLTQKVLSACLFAGARHAKAGEFTKRAFINGKMGLNEAEALGNLLEASTDEQILVSRAGMRGVLTSKIEEIYSSLRFVLASVFAHIDYPDEDLADMTDEEMKGQLLKSKAELLALHDTYRTGKAVSEGINTVILGKTNAGKSSLYNLILDKDAAIVTDIEGTTRDILSSKVSLGRVVLQLFDTAGIRNSDDAVEKIGIDRALSAAEDAELILCVFDGSKNVSDSEYELLEYVKGLNGVKVAVINKSDVGYCDGYNEIIKDFSYSVNISANDRKYRKELSDLLEKIYIDENLDTGNDAMIVNARQSAAVTLALNALDSAITAIDGGYPLEICCSEVELAMQKLSEIDGRAVSEDVVSEIFSKFCVGK